MSADLGLLAAAAEEFVPEDWHPATAGERGTGFEVHGIFLGRRADGAEWMRVDPAAVYHEVPDAPPGVEKPFIDGPPNGVPVNL